MSHAHHDHAGHDHAGHHGGHGQGDQHDHPGGHPLGDRAGGAPRDPAFSLLRVSAVTRLAFAGLAIVAVWTSAFWAMS